MFACSFCKAQVCTGSLGDPVVNVDFGSGDNPGVPLAHSTTNYNYSRNDCPYDGNYTLLNNTFNCYNSTWHNLSEDHTPGDINGYMMLINASFNPGDFYIDTVKGLCANTTYEFSAWIMNVMKPIACAGNGGIKPNLSLRIETTTGIALGTYYTDSIAELTSPQWKQHSLLFTTPTGTNDIVLRLTNHAPGGCGNDLILDDITFRPCGATAKATINFNGGTSVVDVCESDSLVFNLNASLSDGFRNPSFQWQVQEGNKWTDIPGAVKTTFVHNSFRAGNHRYRLSVAETGNISSVACRVVSNVLNVLVNPKPAVVISAADPACEGSDLGLQATGGTSYQWVGPAGFTSSDARPNVIASLGSSGKYYVTVLSRQGCEARDSILVHVYSKTTGHAAKDETICEGGAVVLNATPGLSYLWSPAHGLSSTTIRNPVAKPTDTTRYVITFTDGNGCVSYDTQTVNILKKPVADAGPEVKMYNGQSITLKGAVKGTDVSFHWSPASYMANPQTATPTVNPISDITYTLHVRSNVGCGDHTDHVSVKVLKKIFVPNAFSPNGDGINDVWDIKELQHFPEATVSVFNRYGQEVFRSRGYGKLWNGTLNAKPLPAGNYYYTVDLKTGGIVMNGAVMIIR